MILTTTQTKKQAATITFELQGPREVDDWKPVYLCGNFNNWQLADPRLRLSRVRKGVWRIKVDEAILGPGVLEYKYNRGSWEEEEQNIFGQKSGNRRIDKPTRKVVDKVARWGKKQSPTHPRFHPKINVLSEAYFMPQLDRTRRIFVLLPHDYDKNPGKRYPVLYLQDAQNLFNPQSAYGNWGIDRSLAALAERGLGDIIVVAVEHGHGERISEFSPIRTRHGEGLARRYVRFLAETLKPDIDSQFRTKPQRIYTGIGGSSMGGLVSIYGGLVFPKVFGRLMIFSPSLWMTERLHLNTISFYDPEPTRIYCYGGGKEGSSMAANLRKFKASIKAQKLDDSKVEVEMSIDPDGQHSEWHWGREFARAVNWLFFNGSTSG
jgi:predicted alpha/beta superfamily hydrolase